MAIQKIFRVKWPPMLAFRCLKLTVHPKNLNKYQKRHSTTYILIRVKFAALSAYMDATHAIPETSRYEFVSIKI